MAYILNRSSSSKACRTVASLLLAIMLLIPQFTAYAYTTSDKELEQFRDSSIKDDLGFDLPTFKYKVLYRGKTYALDTDVTMYFYIIVNNDDLQYCNIGLDSFSMSKGKCCIAVVDVNSSYTGDYRYIDCSSSEDFKKQFDELYPNNRLIIGDLVGFYVPEKVVINDYSKLINYQQLVDKLNILNTLVIVLCLASGIIIGCHFLKQFSFWKW